MGPTWGMLQREGQESSSSDTCQPCGLGPLGTPGSSSASPRLGLWPARMLNCWPTLLVAVPVYALPLQPQDSWDSRDSQQQQHQKTEGEKVQKPK